jgi:hypothetical protein
MVNAAQNMPIQRTPIPSVKTIPLDYRCNESTSKMERDLYQLRIKREAFFATDARLSQAFKATGSIDQVLANQLKSHAFDIKKIANEINLATKSIQQSCLKMTANESLGIKMKNLLDEIKLNRQKMSQWKCAYCDVLRANKKIGLTYLIPPKTIMDCINRSSNLDDCRNCCKTIGTTDIMLKNCNQKCVQNNLTPISDTDIANTKAIVDEAKELFSDAIRIIDESADRQSENVSTLTRG